MNRKNKFSMVNPILTIQGISLADFLHAQEELTRKIVREEIAAYNAKANEDKLLTASEVCGLLKITKPTLATWSDSGKLNKLRIGGRTYWKQSEINSALSLLRKYKTH